MGGLVGVRGGEFFFLRGAQREGNGGHICGKNPKMALISDYLAADSSADASADALAIIYMGHFFKEIFYPKTFSSRRI